MVASEWEATTHAVSTLQALDSIGVWEKLFATREKEDSAAAAPEAAEVEQSQAALPAAPPEVEN